MTILGEADIDLRPRRGHHIAVRKMPDSGTPAFEEQDAEGRLSASAFKYYADVDPTLGGMMKTILSCSVIFMAACSSDPDGLPAQGDEDSPVIETVAERAGIRSLDELKIKVGSSWDWTANPEGYPQLIARIGRPAFDRSNEMIRWALAVAAESPRCDRVDYGDVSDRATSDRIVWFVDCTNAERFYIDEEQARAARAKWELEDEDAVAVAAPESARIEGANEAEVASACDRIVRSSLRLPESFDPAWSLNVRRIPTVGRIEVTRTFQASNAAGVELPSAYRCLHDGQKVIEVSLNDVAGWHVVYP